jgi:hypothetical protein
VKARCALFAVLSFFLSCGSSSRATRPQTKENQIARSAHTLAGAVVL